MDIYDLKEGESPLIISIPHAGTFVPERIKNFFTAHALPLPDTDWHVDKLYAAFAKANNATVIKANYSRYVIDLNRPPDDAALYPGQLKVPLCPVETFDGEKIYKDGGEPDEAEISSRVQAYWQPYHDELQRQIERVKAKHGYAIVYDAHSIRSEVSRLFEGTLPDLNLGTANETSCEKNMAQAAYDEAKKSDYKAILNGRFIGGYITRHYGKPEDNVHALQMELAQNTYMDENSFDYDEAKADALKQTLERVLHAITDNSTTGIKPEPV